MDAQAPWGGADQQPDQVTIGASQPQPQPQPQTIAGIPANTQVIYVQAPAFKPSPNFRHISYLVLGIGIALSIILGVGAEMTGSSADFVGRFTNSMCCGSIGIACILDAMYYNEKSNWQQQTGADTSGTIIGMIADIVFAVLCLGIALMFIIGF